jgi:hypothetical protein
MRVANYLIILLESSRLPNKNSCRLFNSNKKIAVLHKIKAQSKYTKK